MTKKQIQETDRIVVESILSEFPALKSEIDDLFCSEEEIAIEWLTSPVPALNGLTPIEAVQQGDLKWVLDILNRLRYGDFS